MRNCVSDSRALILPQVRSIRPSPVRRAAARKICSRTWVSAAVMAGPPGGRSPRTPGRNGRGHRRSSPRYRPRWCTDGNRPGWRCPRPCRPRPCAPSPSAERRSAWGSPGWSRASSSRWRSAWCPRCPGGRWSPGWRPRRGGRISWSAIAGRGSGGRPCGPPSHRRWCARSRTGRSSPPRRRWGSPPWCRRTWPWGPSSRRSPGQRPNGPCSPRGRLRRRRRGSLRR